MSKGKIKKLISKKGFGFIDSHQGADIFFHHSAVAERQFDNLAVGQEVEFTLDAASSKGPRAAFVNPH